MFLFFIFIFGLIIGSFLNCLIWRTYMSEKFWRGRSRCPKCRHGLSWRDNIPVLSFLLLGGKCRYCRKPISWQYPTVELATAALFCLAYIAEPTTYNQQLTTGYKLSVVSYQLVLLRDWFFISTLIVIFVQDLRWQVILDQITLPAMAVALFINLAQGLPLGNLLISGIIGSSFFLAQFLISKGRWIGGGDIRLGGLMGLMLGWPNIILALVLAYWLGAAVGIYLIVIGKKQMSSQMPFGTFLAIGTIIALFWGEKLINLVF